MIYIFVIAHGYVISIWYILLQYQFTLICSQKLLIYTIYYISIWPRVNLWKWHNGKSFPRNWLVTCSRINSSSNSEWNIQMIENISNSVGLNNSFKFIISLCFMCYPDFWNTRLIYQITRGPLATSLNKLESPLLKDALYQVWLKLPFGSWEKKFISSMYFSLFRYYLPLKKGVALQSNKLESPSPKDALCQVWLKLAQWFLRRRWKWE